VRPCFNSGCGKIIGPSYLLGGPVANEFLIHFAGSNYSYRALNRRDPVALTGIEFFTSSKLGDEYTNNIFVGDINNGNLSFLEVNQSRGRINFDSQQNLVYLIL
jgi:aldose sugar dehydrogenase